MKKIVGYYYDWETYCTRCIRDAKHEAEPIFSDSEWDRQPYCGACADELNVVVKKTIVTKHNDSVKITSTEKGGIVVRDMIVYVCETVIEVSNQFTHTYYEVKTYDSRNNKCIYSTAFQSPYEANEYYLFWIKQLKQAYPA